MVKLKLNKDDVKPHDSVAAIITRVDPKTNEILYLTEHHLKHNMLCPVIGKVKDEQDIVDALKAECFEEVGITPTTFSKVCQYSKTYIGRTDPETGKKVDVKVTCHIFGIAKYTGIPINKEPNKHKWVKWFTRGEIEQNRIKTCDAYVWYFAWLDDANTPSMVKPSVTVGFGR